ncbi:hypothetical protein HPB47_005845, partial [Ixodes persulcatus]
PIAGHANLCPHSISTKPQDMDTLLSTVKHEILHALGFSVSLYAYFRDRNGYPLTPRERNGKPSVNKELQTHKWSERVMRKVMRTNWKIHGGSISKISWIMVTPVLCWYLPNYDQAQPLKWGHNLGCDFALKSCKDWIDSRRARGVTIHPFCDKVKKDPLETECTRAATLSLSATWWTTGRNWSQCFRGRSAGLLAKNGDPSPPAPSSPSPPPPPSSQCSSSSGALRTSEPTASSPNAHRLPVSSESGVLTTFERKLSLLDYDAGTTDDPEPTYAPVEKPLDGYRLLSVSAVQTLVAALLCPKCHRELLSLREEGIGINLQFVVSCSTCGDIVMTPHSPSIGKSQQNELAVRLGVIGRDCGISFTKLTNLFGGLNARPPMHVKSYQKIAAKVHDAAMQAASDAMRDAAQAEPRHVGCPDGEDSCCHYNRHKALEAAGKPSTPRPHRPAFSKDVARELEMGITPGSHQEKHAHKVTLGKIVKARVKAQDASKLAHKRRKLEAIASGQQSLEVEEDEKNFALEYYGPGSKCFNHNKEMWEERTCHQASDAVDVIVTDRMLETWKVNEEAEARDAKRAKSECVQGDAAMEAGYVTSPQLRPDLPLLGTRV